MTAPERSKARTSGPMAVAVIASEGDLLRAGGLRRLPDLFELRLDALHNVLAEADADIARLGAPLIITARHPREGGADQLSARERRELLLRFMNRAAYVDVELRSVVPLRTVIETARAQRVRCIISVHALSMMPAADMLKDWADQARAASPDIFKLVVRTDTGEDVAALSTFFEQERKRQRLSAMGVGARGRKSRRLLARAGSILNYGNLGQAQVDGQLSLAELRRILRRTAP